MRNETCHSARADKFALRKSLAEIATCAHQLFTLNSEGFIKTMLLQFQLLEGEQREGAMFAGSIIVA